jgi:hypothetical protein
MRDTSKGHMRVKGPHSGNATRSFSLLLCLGALAGILIWAKLRLVTDIPRSAYADPREQQNLDDLDGHPENAHFGEADDSQKDVELREAQP